MIGKINKGSSFGGCIRYVMGKDNAKIILYDGVLLGRNKDIIESFNYQRKLNPNIKQPVGHIALSFKPEDKPKLTNLVMAQIAVEYMYLMGIKDTQFILVRHFDTTNPHCHLVYNRIGYNGKIIYSQGDYKRNEIATKKLKDKYGLTYAEDKSKTNVEKLRSAEKVKYEIHNAVKDALKHSKTWEEFDKMMKANGIMLEFVLRKTQTSGKKEIQGVRFTKDGYSFKGSQISRDFSYAKLNLKLSWEMQKLQQNNDLKTDNQQQTETENKSQTISNNIIIEGGILPSFNNNKPDEQIPYDEYLRRKKKRKKGRGL